MCEKSFFVYGTLKSGECRHHVFNKILKHDNFKVSKATTKGQLFDLGEFPGMSIGEDMVYGEAITLTEEDYEKVLPFVDLIEGYDASYSDGLYLRKEVDTITDTGEHIKATTYLFSDLTLLERWGKRIHSGKWDTI